MSDPTKTDALQASIKARLSRRGFLATGGTAGAAAAVATLAVGPARAATQPTFDTSYENFTLPKFDADDSLVKIQKKGELVICTSNDWPYSFLHPETKEFTGIDGDIIKACAKMLNIGKVKVETVPFDGMIPGLLDGRFDMVGDSIHYTLKRAKVIDFSFPTYFYAEGLVVAKGNPLKVTKLTDLKGKNCGALLGTNYAEWIQATPGVTFTGYKTWPAMAQDIQNGRLDAALHDQPIIAATIAEHKDWPIELVEAYVPEQAKNPAGYSVYGFRQGDVQLRAGFASAIMYLQDRGEMAKILTKWGLGAVNN